MSEKRGRPQAIDEEGGQCREDKKSRKQEAPKHPPATTSSPKGGGQGCRREDPGRIPTISFNALRRARTTIEDFCKSYFFYHDLSLPDSLFEHLDVLVYVEATIYQMDELNEAVCGRMGGGKGTSSSDGSSSGAFESEDSEGSSSDGAALPGSDELRAVLLSLGLMDDRLEAELDAGLVYWRNERRICAAMRARPGPVASVPPGTEGAKGSGCPFSADEVHSCSLGKSFDYRVLNLLLYRITQRDYDEQLLEFLAVDEHLVDINDDLVDYEEDIFANSFNIFRAYVHLYGSDAELRLVERISEWEERRERLLAALPKRIQDRVREREKEAAADAGEGSEKWTFPAPILDEPHYIRLYGPPQGQQDVDEQDEEEQHQ